MARDQEYEMVQEATTTDPKSPMLRSSIAPILGSTSTTSQLQQNPNRTIKQGMLRDWWLESVAVLLSAVALVAIIVTLMPYDNQPLPDWPYTITLNTLISIYVIIFKASILFMTARALSQLKWLWFQKRHPLSDIEVFDEASRGPYGSLKLLWAISPRHWLAWVGAIVTIVMVIVGPFAQQLLTYHGCTVSLSGVQASIPRSTFLDSLGPDSTHIGAALTSVPPNWQQSINAGLFAPGQKVPVDCPTGNCTFPESYATVGYCSKCTDVSDQLSIVNQTIHIMFNGLNQTKWEYNTSLPSGASSISRSDDGSFNWSSISVRTWGTGSNMETHVDIILGQVPDDTFRESFVEDNSTCVAQEGSTSWRCRGYGAATCYLHPCVKKFLGNVTLGSLHETILDTSPQDQWSNLGWAGIVAVLDLQCVTQQDRAALLQANYSIADNQKWLAYNVSWNVTDKPSEDAPFPQSLQARGCLYAFYYDIPGSIDNWMASFFDGYISSYAAAETDPRVLTGPQNLQTIFNWGNISFESVEATFENITDSMTTTVRQTAHGNNSAPVLGIVQQQKTCVSVHWAWLSFPGALIVIISIFFIATIVEQHRSSPRLPSWKSSLLPILVPAVMMKIRDDSGHGGDDGELETIAGRTMVRLSRTAQGLELKES